MIQPCTKPVRWVREFVVMTLITLAAAFLFGSFYVKDWTWTAYGYALVVAAIFGVVMRVVPGELAPWLVARLIPRGTPTSFKTVAIAMCVFALAGIVGTYLSLTFSGWVLGLDFFGNWRSVYLQFFIGLIVTLLVAISIYGVMLYRELLQKTREATAAREAAVNAELRALRAQVNPHFLFNTLNSISALIAVNPNLAEQMVQKLSDIFRYVLVVKDTVTIEEELKFIRTYLDIEQVRFEEKLKVSVEADPGTLGFCVPSLILQPIVENAIKHGLADEMSGGALTVRSQVQNGHVVIHVIDTGTRTGPMSGLGIGLKNVKDRLEKTYGGSARLEMVPHRPHGMQVTITLPQAIRRHES